MGAINRRLFLVRSSMAVAAAGVATVLAPAVTAAETEAPAAGSAADSATATMTEPLVAHVRDLASGEIGLYSGTREVTFHDTGLANRLFNASH
jgi:hypothetical protein